MVIKKKKILQCYHSVEVVYKVANAVQIMNGLPIFTLFLWLPAVVFEAHKCFRFLACKGTETAPAPLRLNLSITCNSGLQIHANSGLRRESPDDMF